ncbi:MAG: ferritin-like domain-containing protein [Hyphomicrobium sp.]
MQNPTAPLSPTQIEALKSLHTILIDSRNGYDEAVKDAEGKGLTPLFREMRELRSRHADEVTRYLTAAGQAADPSGSFMSSVHRAVISVRAALTGLGDSVLPGLIDGEERIISAYDDTTKLLTPGSDMHQTLLEQRQTVADKIADMRRRKDLAA